MKLFPLLAATALFTAPAQADQTRAFCSIAPHDHTIPFKQGPCGLDYYEGAIHVTMDGKTYTFLSSEEGKSYTRKDTRAGIWLHREGEISVAVLWEKPDREPGGW